MNFKEINPGKIVTATKLEKCPNLKAVIRKYTKEKTIKEHTVLLHKGEVCTNIYFIIQGAIKQYFYKDKNEKKTLEKFYLDGTMASDFDSFIDASISNTSLEAVHGSILWVLDRAHFNQLIVDIPEFKQKFTQCIVKLDNIRNKDVNYSLLMALYKKLDA